VGVYSRPFPADPPVPGAVLGRNPQSDDAMSAVPLRTIVPVSRFEQLRQAQSIVRGEAAALETVARRLDGRFCDAVELILACRGHVVATGVGKAGLIAQKIVATLSSTGTRSHFLHPVEAVHGDLGCLAAGDVVLALSNSGETEEVCRLGQIFRQLEVPLIALTATDQSSLAADAEVVIPYGQLQEVDTNGLAPSTTTTAMLSVGDALALVVSRARNFSPEQFALFHPGGSLGHRLQTVSDIMRSKDQVRIACQTSSVREVFTTLSKPERRSGAVMLVDESGRLTGVFTDSDLAKLLERRCDRQFDEAISAVMSRTPLAVPPDARLVDVIDMLAHRKISEVPVVDDERRPVGLVDITDIIGVFPTSSDAA